MKNLLKWATYLLVATLIFHVSCEDDPPVVDNTPSPVGEWVLMSAKLVDGNIKLKLPAFRRAIVNGSSSMLWGGATIVAFHQLH